MPPSNEALPISPLATDWGILIRGTPFHSAEPDERVAHVAQPCEQPAHYDRLER